MPRLSVISGEEQRFITFEPGPTLRDILDTTDLRVRSGCRGSGVCGLCRVQIETGGHGQTGADLPWCEAVETPGEHLMLSVDELRNGLRLACQVIPQGDMRIKIVNPAPRSTWRKLGPLEQAVLKKGTRGPYGVAVDLGTTTVSLSLWDFRHNQRLSGRFGLNQQLQHGSDVLTRLVAAGESTERAGELSRLAKDSIEEAILDICSREGYDLREIREIAVVGNTPMLAILAEKGYDLLLHPEYWAMKIDCRSEDTKGWFEAGGLHTGVKVEIVQPLAGFVGSDLLAGVLSTGLTEQGAGSLLIDFGTNSEIALWDGKTLWVTSAAGGPAFEGSGISCGMPAESGAVYRIDQQDHHGRSRWITQVIDEGQAKGLCGSGIIDLVAHLVRTGKLDRKGRLATELRDKGFVLEECPGISLDSRDVDLFQRAKAAIGTGVQVLLDRARWPMEDLRRICICGTFGQYLNIQHAGEIGLLPSTSSQRVELCGNSALEGCELLLSLPERKERLDALRRKCRLVNLSQAPEFEDLFLENLFLQPMKGNRFMKMTSSYEEQYTESFIKAAQYIVRLTAQQDVLEQLGRIIVEYFQAEWVVFAYEGPSGEIILKNQTASDQDLSETVRMGKTKETIRDVMDTGFLALETVVLSESYRAAFLPLTDLTQARIVVIIAHKATSPPSSPLLNLYLALTGIAGSTLGRISTERELREANQALQVEVGVRKRAEEAVKLERQRFHDVLEMLPAYVVLLSPGYQVAFANRFFRERYGESRSRRCFDYLYGRTEPCTFCQSFSVLKTKASHHWEKTGPDGSQYDIYDFPFSDTDGSTLILEMGIDITERKRLEDTLRQSEKKVRFFASQCLTAQETERKRIAAELHDSIAASLAAIKFRIEKTLAEMEQGIVKTESLQGLVAMVQQTVGETRRIMADLRPAILDDLGLIAAMNWLCREYPKTYSHIVVDCEIGLSEEDLTDSLKTPIFRIAQEALNNIAKHSRAGRVCLSLRKEGDKIELAIQDNGTGFDVDKVVKGFGLSTMRERAELSGGTFAIESGEEGTIIRASWPSE
ncbi:MAG: ASKHA domain-containing protein [Thermodesulfobacteriota bacterium]